MFDLKNYFATVNEINSEFQIIVIVYSPNCLFLLELTPVNLIPCVYASVKAVATLPKQAHAHLRNTQQTQYDKNTQQIL